MSVRVRKSCFIALVFIFFAQTVLVYTDPTAREMPPLSEQAARGRAIWHENNCQSCHQLYGFGGFLGPDLTNASEHLTQARLDTVLTVGAAQMPAFELDEEERNALVAFLSELNTTGIGQLAPAASMKTSDVLDQAIAAALRDGASELSAAQARGRDVVVAQDCLGCHLPNPFAAKKGTDLTLLVGKLGGAGIDFIVTAGIPAKGMPGFKLERAELDDLVTFLTWLGENAASVRQTFSAVSTPAGETTLPWFEYTR